MKFITSRITVSSLVITILQLFLALNLNAQNANQKDSVVFIFKSEGQSWVVPEGVTQVHVNAYGAQGGSVNGGKGGLVRSELTVKPGSKLWVYVGSQPVADDGGYNGGGKGCGKGTGGGGASDIRVDGTTLESRIIVAGGGGGFGYGGVAGVGGGLEGGDGWYDTTSYHFAKGGTQKQGGAGARAYFSLPGQLGQGGQGIENHGNCSNGAMAGGGGGYYGGGGGGAGGGGGGSSYANSDNKNVIHRQGVNEGNGRVVIYWEKPKK